MSDDLPELSKGARDLLAAEKKAGAAPGKARVSARLDATLFGPMPGGGGGGGSGSSGGSDGGATGASGGAKASIAASPARWMSHALVGVVGIVAGAGLTIALKKPEIVQTPPTVVSVYVEREKASSDVVSVPSVLLTTAPPPSESSTAMIASNAPITSGTTASAPRGADTVAAERALLDPARTALGRGDGASALDGVNKHAQKFPNGQLAEEREAIAIQALVLLHRTDEARARARKFQAIYPNSVLGPSVRAAIGAEP